MTNTEPVDTLADPTKPSEIIVAIPHQAMVVAVLKSLLGITVESVEESTELGLALLTFKSETDDSRVMKALYAYFEYKYAGWVPTMGRNRYLSKVVGAGEISFGVGALGGGSTDGEISFGIGGRGGGGVRPDGEISFGAGGRGGGGGQGDGEISFGGGGKPTPVPQPRDWPPTREYLDQSVRIAVLDTAVDDSGALRGWLSRDSVRLAPSTSTREVSDGHGTFVTGLIVSQAPSAVIEVHRILGDNGTATSWAVAKAIARLGNGDFDVLNLSLGCHTKDAKPPLALATAIARVVADTVVVAAAGNHGRSRVPTWPAALDGVVSVGAAEKNGKLAAFTPPDAPWIDITAPGVDLVSTFLKGTVNVREDDDQTDGEPTKFVEGFAKWSGTSFAAALVSGAIAAGIEPGERSAHASYRRLLKAATPTGEEGAPPFLPLKTLGDATPRPPTSDPAAETDERDA